MKLIDKFTKAHDKLKEPSSNKNRVLDEVLDLLMTSIETNSSFNMLEEIYTNASDIGTGKITKKPWENDKHKEFDEFLYAVECDDLDGSIICTIAMVANMVKNNLTNRRKFLDNALSAYDKRHERGPKILAGLLD